MNDRIDLKKVPLAGVLIALAGLPGTGKSTIAAEIARRLGAIVLSKDTIRAELFSTGEIQFTREQDDFCMKMLVIAAGDILKTKPEQTIIVDGRTFSKSYQVEQLFAEAKALKKNPVIIECICDDAVARQRIEGDLHTGIHPAANRTYQLYMDLKAKAEPIVIDHLVIDTGKASLERCVEHCLEYLAVVCDE
jgi:predicted kinase